MAKPTPLIAGNWKMNKGTQAEATALTHEVMAQLSALNAGSGSVEVVICPPYTALHAVRQAIGDSPLLTLGAQDVYWKSAGAYTGQVSPEMLVDAGVSSVILGHSERRGRFGVAEPDFSEGVLKHFGETDATVNRKAIAALGAGLRPIICVGETLAERQAGHTDALIQAQTQAALDGVSGAHMGNVVFAYEPVWAIGTGETCAASEADRVCELIRGTVAELYDPRIAEGVRVLYGGSMKADNAAELLSQSDINGGLIGGASLKPADFAAVVKAAVQ